MLGKRLIKSNDAGGGGCTNTVDLYNPFPDGGGVALYQLNGDATDVSGNYDGTASNVTYGAGQFGQAGVFNGSSSIIKNTQLGIDFRGQTNLTISVWVKTSGHSSSTQINNIVSFSNTNDPSTELDIWFRGSSGNVIYIENRNDGVNSIAATGTDNIADNTWHHIVFTADNNGTKLYLDGIEKTLNFAIGNSSTQISMPNDLNQFNIGANQDSGGVQWHADAEIDQVRIFNRALRPYEVEALYTEEYCTPTIVPSEHFNTVTYTGNGGTKNVTGVGFQPDWVWIKGRDYVSNNHSYDSVRGVQKTIYQNLTNAEVTYSDGLSSFDSDGFTLGSNPGINMSGQDLVAWNFKAGGAAVTNTDGTITSQVSANTEAGFSIVKYNLSSPSASDTIGHGLGVEPSVIITKGTDGVIEWYTYHKDVGTGKYLRLENTAAAVSYANGFSTVNDTVWQEYFTAQPFEKIAYCFAEVEGFSNFGSYVGNGTTSGDAIVTGFEPAMIIVKRTDLTGDWRIWDNKRSIENPRNEVLKPNTSEAEETNSPNAVIDFLENGFQPKSTHSSVNASGASYIYMAFAADPTAVEPTLEDSFNTVTYTGNEVSGRQITGVGFQPDFVWIKDRGDGTHWHNLFDSVRGASERLFSNTTNAESFYNESLQSFDNDGFTVGLDPDVNRNGGGIVAWNWKGAEIPAINSNGSIPSVVSANPAAGFSIVSWTGTTTTSDTIGHGLSEVPTIVLMKNRSSTSDWFYYTTQIDGSYDYLRFNSTNAKANSGRNAPTSNVFDQSTMAGAIGSGDECIAYCFAEVAGFSKFGSYTGNGLPLGPTIDCGFEPAFVMYKCTTQVGNWIIVDNKRAITNPRTPHLRANSSSADDFGAGEYINFIANGFQPSGVSNFNNNSNGQTYIYMAFANQF